MAARVTIKPMFSVLCKVIACKRYSKLEPLDENDAIQEGMPFKFGPDFGQKAAVSCNLCWNCCSNAEREKEREREKQRRRNSPEVSWNSKAGITFSLERAGASLPKTTRHLLTPGDLSSSFTQGVNNSRLAICARACLCGQRSRGFQTVTRRC